MHRPVYRYQFDARTSMDEVEASLVLTVMAVESLHGECAVQLAAPHYFDADRRACIVDGSIPVGRDFNRLLLGYLRREFGPTSFCVEQVDSPTQSTSAA